MTGPSGPSGDEEPDGPANPRSARDGRGTERPERARAAAVAVASCFGLLCFTALYAVGPGTIHFTNDIATSMTVAELMLAGEPALLGPPSHAGGRHLGPAYYGYVALGHLLAGGDELRSVVWFSVMKLLGAAALIVPVLLLSRRSSFPFAMATTWLFVAAGRGIDMLRTPWHANYVLLPQALFLATYCLAMRWGWRGVLPCGLFASLLLQSRFTSGPLLAALAIMLLARLLLAPARAPAGRARPLVGRGAQITYAVLTALSWVPTILFELRHPSNLLKILDVQSGAGAEGAGLAPALGEVASYWLKCLVKRSALMPARSWTPEAWADDPLRLVVAAVAIALFLWLAVDYLRRAHAEQRWIFSSLLVGSLAYVPALSLVVPPLYDAYLNETAFLPPVVAGVLTGHAWSLLRAERPGYVRAAAAAFGIVVAVLAGESAVRGFRFVTGNPFGDVGTLAHARQVADVIESDSFGERRRVVYTWGRNYNVGDAYHHLLEGELAHHNAYRNAFVELPSFRPENGVHPVVFYMLTCRPRAEDLRVQPPWDSYRRRFGFLRHERDVSLAACSTCTTCELRRFSQRRRPPMR